MNVNQPNLTDASPLFQPMSHPSVDPVTRDAIYRTDFVCFIGKCFETLAPGSPFYMNWHIYALAYQLEQVRLGKIRRLIVNMPPRSLKSIVSSVAFPAFVLGHNPTERLIAASYGADLAIKHSNDFRAILNSPWYRRLFPGTQISRIKNTEFEVVTTRSGFRLATSIDGTLTGRGGNIVIVDDPLKPIDALSDSKREAVNNWFSNTLLSRLDDKRTGAIIVVMQRLHTDDLTGTLLRSSNDWNCAQPPRDCRAGGKHPDRRRQISLAPCWRSAAYQAGAKIRSRLAPFAAWCGHVCGPISAGSQPAGRRLDQAGLVPPL